MTTLVDYKRQTEIFDPINQKINIIVIGAGSIGSFVTLTLAKLGFNKIKVYDGDKVEIHNIPNQFYQIDDIDRPKVCALQDIVKNFTGIEIKVCRDFLTNPEEQIMKEPNTVIIYALDSLEVRKELTEKFKDWPIKLVDIRVGGEGWQIYTADFTNTTQYEQYRETLNVEVRKLPCGAQSVIYNILNVSSEAARVVKLINQGEMPLRIMKREMKNFLFVAGEHVGQ